MYMEHYYIDGTLRQGWFCYNCGQPGSMYAHSLEFDRYTCDTAKGNLVNKLVRANPPKGIKPRFERKGVIWTE